MATYIQKKREIHLKTEELSTKFSIIQDKEENQTLKKTLELVNFKPASITSKYYRNIPKDYLTERPLFDHKISTVSKFYEKNISKLQRLDSLLHSDSSNYANNNPLVNFT